jgi:hypothetical protein
LAEEVIPANVCESHVGFKYVSYFFTVAFTLELLGKIFVQRLNFLSRSNIDFSWNAFDSLIVSLSLGDIMVELLASGGGGIDLSQAKLVRVLRVVRIMRILRTIRFVKDLRVMLDGILVSGSAIVWALLILIGLQYMLAIVIMNIVKLHLENCAGSTDPKLVADREMLLSPENGYTKLNDIIWYLFLGITGGADWADYVTPLTELGDGWQWIFRILFMLYVSIVQLCVLNILTGVFVDNANKIVGHDEANMLSVEMEERSMFNDAMAGIFDEICEAEDDHGARTIGSKAFESIVGDDKIQRQFLKLGVEVSEDNADQFFQMIDFDGDGQVSCEDFQSGIYRMHGAAKSIDMAQLIVNSQKAVAMLATLLERLQGPKARPVKTNRSNNAATVKVSEKVARLSLKFNNDMSVARASHHQADGSASGTLGRLFKLGSQTFS